VENYGRADRPQMTTWHMHIASKITKIINKHSEYIIVIAFPRQLLIHERASMLRLRTLPILFLSQCHASGSTQHILIPYLFDIRPNDREHF
jgi:hypothetical protein